MKRKSTRKIVVAVTALVVIVCGVVLYVWIPLAQQSSETADRSALKSGQGKAYEDLSTSELDARAQQETGHTVAELKKIKLDKSSLSSFDKANEVGLVLLAADEPKKSLMAFKVAADSKATDEQKDIDFYIAYQNAADAAGDYAQGDQAVRQQIAWYKRSPDPAAAQQIPILEQRLSVRETERNE